MSEPMIGAVAEARLARRFAKANVEQTDQTRALVAAIGAAGRGEARAAAARLDAIGALFTLRMAQFGECAEWASDTSDMVASEVAAELRLSHSGARSQLRYARAMTERLPRVAAVFRAGDIDFAMFKTVVFRTYLITNDLVLSFVDAELSYEVGSWTALTRKRLAAKVDAVVTRADRDAIRMPPNVAMELGVWVDERPDGSGLADVSATVFASTGHAMDRRVAALAATVCDQDPRTADERRAHAVQAMVDGADRMGCRCGRADCPAGAKPPAAQVVIHVIAEQGTVEGRTDAPGLDVGSGSLIPPALVAELAQMARSRPLVHPGDTPPEHGYAPSRALAAFVRARDLTCRAPGCDKPAIGCDVDHTIPYAAGGLTCASNLKCLCRDHHLLKTFWGWRDEQLPDGTVIWTSPAGQRYVTTAGSASLFPSLCLPTAAHVADPVASQSTADERTAMMPRRRHTREQERAARITAERKANLRARCHYRLKAPPPNTIQDPDPPPF